MTSLSSTDIASVLRNCTCISRGGTTHSGANGWKCSRSVTECSVCGVSESDSQPRMSRPNDSVTHPKTCLVVIYYTALSSVTPKAVRDESGSSCDDELPGRCAATDSFEFGMSAHEACQFGAMKQTVALSMGKARLHHTLRPREVHESALLLICSHRCH